MKYCGSVKTLFMSQNETVQLCPAQKRAFEALCSGMEAGAIFRVWGGIGRGKTTVLGELHKRTGGAFLNLRDFVESSAKNHPLALEETLSWCWMRCVHTRW